MEEKKLVELFEKKPEFVKNIISLKTEKEVLDAFSTEGIKLTLEELNAVRDIVVVAAENAGKISDEEVEKVVGGIKFDKKTVKKAVAVVGGVAAVGITAGGIYWWKNKNKKDSCNYDIFNGDDGSSNSNSSSDESLCISFSIPDIDSWDIEGEE